MSDLISRSDLLELYADTPEIKLDVYHVPIPVVRQNILDMPAVDAYTAHEVAEIIAEILGDPCACNFNSIDEWLPFKCELRDACPHTEGVACWEQYLKFKGERNG